MHNEHETPLSENLQCGKAACLLQLNGQQREAVFVAPLIDFIRQAATSDKRTAQTAAAYLAVALGPLINKFSSSAHPIPVWASSQGKPQAGHAHAVWIMPCLYVVYSCREGSLGNCVRKQSIVTFAIFLGSCAQTQISRTTSAKNMYVQCMASSRLST